MNRLKSSFSLIEVLIFVTILSGFFVIAASVVAVSLRNLKISEHKLIASHYATEVMEWVRSQSQDDWNDFVTTYAPTAGKTYCFGTSPITGWPAATPCTNSFNSLSPAIFNREVSLTGSNGSCGFTCQVKVDITVEWKDSGIGFTVPVSSVFSVWE